jgi:site-specific DNA recombinase
LGRSLKALIEAHGELERAGVTIRSATEPFDTSSPIGRFVFQLLASLAELERSTIVERMTLGRDRVARAGRWLGGPVPLGYELRADGQLAPSERPVDGLAMTEAGLVRDVFERLAAGSTIMAEARRLNVLGVASIKRYQGDAAPRVGGAWDRSRLSRLVKNPLYAGRAILRSRHGAIERAVPALVDLRTWERANAQLQLNRRYPVESASRRRYLLRGKIVCDKCGSAYSGVTTERYAYYRCNSIKDWYDNPPARPECRGKSLPGAWIEREIWEDCKRFVLDPGAALAEAQRQLAERLAASTGLLDERDQVEVALAEKERERERVLTLYRRGRLTLAEVEAQLEAMAREADVLRARAAAIDAQTDLARAGRMRFAEAAAVLADLRASVEDIERTGDADAKRTIVETLVKEIRVETIAAEGQRCARVRVTYWFGDRSCSGGAQRKCLPRVSSASSRFTSSAVAAEKSVAVKIEPRSTITRSSCTYRNGPGRPSPGLFVSTPQSMSEPGRSPRAGPSTIRV